MVLFNHESKIKSSFRRNIVISNTVQQLFPKHAKFVLRVDELEKLNLTTGKIISTLAREHLFSTDSRYCNFLQGITRFSIPWTGTYRVKKYSRSGVNLRFKIDKKG